MRVSLDGGTLSFRLAATCRLLLVCVATLACPPPGKGPKAERGYAEAQPVIDALIAFHRANNAYPAILSQLVPAYLDSMSLTSATQYRKLESDDYEVSFRYAGPGMNTCVYRASARKWSCSGLF
jgi:hypothetical protein